MNTKNLLLASLVGGLITILLTNLPYINIINCLLCVGFWGGPLFAVWMYRKQTGTVTLGQGIGIGTLAGVWAAIVGFLIAQLTGASAQALMQTYAQLGQVMPPESGFALPQPGAMSFIVDLFGAGFGIFFGFVGGLIGGAIFKTPPAAPTPTV